jgi:hypothetical protein
LAGPAVHLTGKPSRLGGHVARIFGWLTLVFGSMIALLVGAFFQWLIPAGIVGWVFGLGIFVISLIITFALVRGGGALRDSGARAEARTFEQAVFALADARGGILSTLDVAQVLGVSDAEADRLLTDFAKQNPERVRVEIDPNGTLVYQFPHAMLASAKTQYAQEAIDLAAVEAEAASRAATRRGS